MPPTGGGLGGARPWGRSELIVVWGGNPVHTQVNFMHWVQKARRGRDVPLVVIDPYRTATAANSWYSASITWRVSTIRSGS